MIRHFLTRCLVAATLILGVSCDDPQMQAMHTKLAEAEAKLAEAEAKLGSLNRPAPVVSDNSESNTRLFAEVSSLKSQLQEQQKKLDSIFQIVSELRSKPSHQTLAVAPTISPVQGTPNSSPPSNGGRTLTPVGSRNLAPVDPNAPPIRQVGPTGPSGSAVLDLGN